jgi:hypothetical protein
MKDNFIREENPKITLLENIQTNERTNRQSYIIVYIELSMKSSDELKRLPGTT